MSCGVEDAHRRSQSDIFASLSHYERILLGDQNSTMYAGIQKTESRQNNREGKKKKQDRRSSPSTDASTVSAFFAFAFTPSIAIIDIPTIPQNNCTLQIIQQLADSIKPATPQLCLHVTSHFFFSSLPRAVYNSSLFGRNQVSI